MLTVNEVREFEGLDALTTESPVKTERGRRHKAKIARKYRIVRLQVQHQKTVQLMSDVEEMQDVIEQWDSRIHWINWDEAGDEGKPTIARCGAVVHNGDQWYSSGALDDDLAVVSCPDCSSMPEYGLKLLAQTDLGEETNVRSILPDGRIVNPVGEIFLGEAEPCVLESGILDLLQGVEAALFGTEDE